MPKTDPLLTCKVCGLSWEDYYPWDEDGLSPSFDICSCCGVTFGYEDFTPLAVKSSRTAWLQSGANWRFLSKEVKSQFEKWVLHESLGNVIDEVDVETLEKNSKSQIIVVTEKSGNKVLYDPESDTFAVKLSE